MMSSFFLGLMARLYENRREEGGGVIEKSKKIIDIIYEGIPKEIS